MLDPEFKLLRHFFSLEFPKWVVQMGFEPAGFLASLNSRGVQPRWSPVFRRAFRRAFQFCGIQVDGRIFLNWFMPYIFFPGIASGLALQQKSRNADSWCWWKQPSSTSTACLQGASADAGQYDRWLAEVDCLRARQLGFLMFTYLQNPCLKKTMLIIETGISPLTGRQKPLLSYRTFCTVQFLGERKVTKGWKNSAVEWPKSKVGLVLRIDPCVWLMGLANSIIWADSCVRKSGQPRKKPWLSINVRFHLLGKRPDRSPISSWHPKSGV